MIALDLAEFADAGIIREETFRRRLLDLDLDALRDQEVFIKGCGQLPIPTWAFMMMAVRVAQVADSVTYGEQAQPVLVFERAAATRA